MYPLSTNRVFRRQFGTDIRAISSLVNNKHRAFVASGELGRPCSGVSVCGGRPARRGRSPRTGDGCTGPALSRRSGVTGHHRAMTLRYWCWCTLAGRPAVSARICPTDRPVRPPVTARRCWRCPTYPTCPHCSRMRPPHYRPTQSQSHRPLIFYLMWYCYY